MHYSFFLQECLAGTLSFSNENALFVIEALERFIAHGSLMDPVNSLTDITSIWIGHDVISFGPKR